jgi:hypothetical protein
MDRKIQLGAIGTLIACAVLVVAGRSEPKASYLEPDLWFYQRVIRMMRDSNMQKNVTEDEVAGYYEGLLAGRRVNLLARATDSSDYRFRGDYLYYEAKPNLDVADYDDPALRHVTNRYGMPDVDYAMEASPQTRRLAIIGDSITRGQGAPFGQNFESLLEQRLNESPTIPGVSK